MPSWRRKGSQSPYSWSSPMPSWLITIARPISLCSRRDTRSTTLAKTKPTGIAEYINAAPKEGQRNLRELYALLKKAAPGARQGLKWRSPVFEEKRILFAFAAFKSHL